jgi:hypothetical protein
MISKIYGYTTGEPQSKFLLYDFFYMPLFPVRSLREIGLALVWSQKKGSSTEAPL